MSAFLKLDHCELCSRDLPWEWVPAVVAAGRNLPGTGVWRSRLTAGACPNCADRAAARTLRDQRAQARRVELIRILGGSKPYREFTFSRFMVTENNRRAFDAARHFNPRRGNLCLWGPHSSGKTHLAIAALRRTFDQALGAAVATPASLLRRVRAQLPGHEQRAIDAFTSVGVLLLDDLGGASVPPSTLQLLQELLDSRNYRDRFGLLITSRCSPTLAGRCFGDSGVAWRIVRMCTVVEIRGPETLGDGGRVD